MIFPLLALVAANLFGATKPDPLVALDGGVISTPIEWEALRRPEVLELFRENVYGRNAVERPDSLRFERVGEEEMAFDGLATRSRVRIAYAGPGGEGGIGVTIYYPAKVKPKGCFVLIVNRSRRIIDEAERDPAGFWPVRDILERGYATAAFHNSDVAPDRAADAFGRGVFGIFDPANESRAANAWGAIAAWAWGASRVLDYLETDPRLDGVPFAVAGHSRGGKAALWCGAQDRRVALTISNNSGRTGAALGQVMRGETVKKINTTFPHWFAANYHAYNERPDELPVDQHLLIGLMAPRLVYVASASEDDNADPAAEFQSCVEATPVFALYGKSGVEAAVAPGAGETRHEGNIGYHLRAGPHDLRREDWRHYLEFANRWLR